MVGHAADTQTPLVFIPSFTMSQKLYPVSARYWFTLDSVLLKSPNGSVSFNGSRGIYAPAEYSFHCMSVNSFRDPLLIRGESDPNTSNWMVNFVDFQVLMPFSCTYFTKALMSQLGLGISTVDSNGYDFGFPRFRLDFQLNRCRQHALQRPSSILPVPMLHVVPSLLQPTVRALFTVLSIKTQ